MTRILPGTRRATLALPEPRERGRIDQAFESVLGHREPPASTASALEQVLGEPRDTGAQDVLVPWNLQAHDGLSYLTRPTIPVCAYVCANVDLGTSQAPRPQADGVSGNAPAAAKRDATAPSQNVAAFDATVLDGPCIAMQTPEPEVVTSSVLKESPASGGLPFAPRHLSWTQTDDGLVAIVRDYRLSTKAMPALVDALCASASQRGVRLLRIVINAREVWHAVPPSRPLRQGA